MSDLGNTIAFAIASSQRMLDGFIADLSPAEMQHRPVPKANCAAWIVGHLISSDRRVLGRVGVKDLPALPEGFEQRYARDEHAPFAADYGDVTVLRPLWNRHREMLAQAAGAMPAEQLMQAVDPPHPRFKTVGEMLQFMALHAAVHAGQISSIRRSLGRPPLV